MTKLKEAKDTYNYIPTYKDYTDGGVLSDFESLLSEKDYLTLKIEHAYKVIEGLKAAIDKAEERLYHVEDAIQEEGHGIFGSAWIVHWDNPLREGGNEDSQS